jgi:imidazolonepropionase-like amidohydrolase
MKKLSICATLFLAGAIIYGVTIRGQSPSGGKSTALSLRGETGNFKVHRMLHLLGEERYKIAPTDGGLRLNATFEYSDRGRKRGTTAVLHTNSDYTPLSLELSGEGGPYAVNIQGGAATVQELGTSRTFAPPEWYFTISGSQPFAVQMMMMRYWKAHGRPTRLNGLRTSSAAEPIEIELAGHDSITVNGQTVQLERYAITNLGFGRETLWMNARGDLAAAMTFANAPSIEVVRSDYESALPQLFRKGVEQEMTNLVAIGHQVSPERIGTFAISGARLVDATGAPPVEDSVVIVRNGRIAAVGPRSEVVIPPGMAIVNAAGQTLLPGLWEMHAHFSGVEFGPALLAAGVTTARDCGGEFDYLVAQRDTLDKGTAIGPRLLLAGLVDGGGLNAFGHVTADTVKEGLAVVGRYYAAGFQQIKLYDLLKPEVVKAIAAEAHRLHMTVTGHVPQALNTFEGVEAGMDQINHLTYVSDMMRTPSTGDGVIDVNSDTAKKAIQFLKEHHTVIDPTAGWQEMRGHSKDVDVASFEPGITKAPFFLYAHFRAFGGDIAAEKARLANMQALAVIGALHKAGIPIVPGTDTGLVGYGLHRELELYVAAGLTPLEAIQSATVVSARAMNLDGDSGTVVVGKRADLILVAGDPLTNISDIRNVSWVVANGRLYDPAKLWQSVGFRP